MYTLFGNKENRKTKKTEKTKKSEKTKKIEGNKMKTNMIMKNQSEENLGTFVTQTIIKKWGNSQGIRLSKEVLSKMNLKEDDTIGINIYDGKMIIEKVNKPKYLNLTERLEAFYQRPIDEIFVENTEEVNVGAPVGNEIW